MLIWTEMGRPYRGIDVWCQVLEEGLGGFLKPEMSKEVGDTGWGRGLMGNE